MRFSPLSESRVAASRLTSVGFFTLLEWFTWWLRPRFWAPYPVEGLRVSELVSIICADTGSFVMAVFATWVSDSGGRSWGPGSSDFSCQASLGRGMIENCFRCHYFERVNFSCAASSERSSTRFYNFLGLLPSSCAPQWRMCRQIPHGTGGKHAQLWCLILRSLNLCEMGSEKIYSGSCPWFPFGLPCRTSL